MKKFLASLGLAGILCLSPFSTSCFGACDPPLDFKGIVGGSGCWIQNVSKCKVYEFIPQKGYGSLFSWIVADTSIWDDADFDQYVNGEGANKKYFVSFSAFYPDAGLSALKTRMTNLKGKYGDKLVGAIYDYEFPYDETRTISDLTTVFNHAKSLCMLFGVVVDPNPEKSIERYGIDYGQAQQFAHFLLPMLYCQWLDCCRIPLSIQTLYKKEKEATSASNIPIVPLVAITATGKYGSTAGSQCEPVITPQQILDNYSELIFRNRPEAIGFFNISDIDEGHLGAIKILP